MAGFSFSDASDILKILYEPGCPPLEYMKFPCLATMPKSTNWGGKQGMEAFSFAPNANGSADSATSLSQVSSPAQFGVISPTPKDYYYTVELENKAKIAAESAGDFGSFVAALDEFLIQAMIRGWEKMTEIRLFGDGAGALGAVGVSGISTTTLSLATPEDGVNFEVGMELVAAADSATAIRSGSATVTKVIRSDDGTAKLVTDSNWASQISGITDGDLLFPKGDYSGASDRLMISGFEGWNPYTTPSASDSFYGRNRSTDAERLAGTRYNGSTMTILEAAINAPSVCGSFGGAVDFGFYNPRRAREMSVLLQGQKEYETINGVAPNGEVMADLGFQAVKVMSDMGEISMLTSPFCPVNRIYFRKRGNDVLKSMGNAPRILESGGVIWFPAYNSFNFQVRSISLMNLFVTKPVDQCVVYV